MTATNLHAEFGVELTGYEGPTGEFFEVLEAKIIDAGGNVLQGPAKVGPWLTKYNKFGRIPHDIVATKLGRKIASADHLCDYAVTN